MVLMNLPDEQAEKPEHGQHGQSGGDAAKHARAAGNKLAVP